MSLAEIFTEFDTFFFDLDGVVWECEKLLPGVLEFLTRLQASGKAIYYVSNNAIHSRNSFHILFQSLSLPSQVSNIICASYSSSLYLLSNFAPSSKVLVIGSQGLVEEISQAGFEVISCEHMESIRLSTSQLGNIEFDPEVKAVVVGFTPRLNFYMLSYALNCMKNGAVLLTGNYDFSDKFGKYNVPGSGCTVEFLRYALNTGFVNVGKPEKFMLDQIIERDHLDRNKCVMFGDKMMTDIKLAVNAGIKSVLVLTGVENQETYLNYDFRPDYVLDNLLLDP